MLSPRLPPSAVPKPLGGLMLSARAQVLQGTMPLLCPGVRDRSRAVINNNVIYSFTPSDTGTCEWLAVGWPVKHLSSLQLKASKQPGHTNPAPWCFLGSTLGLDMGIPSLAQRTKADGLSCTLPAPELLAGPPELTEESQAHSEHNWACWDSLNTDGIWYCIHKATEQLMLSSN